MKNKYSFKTKALALLLTLVMVVAFVPVFASLAAEGDLSAESGNLAMGEGVTVITSTEEGRTPHIDGIWDPAKLNDGVADGVGGFHSNKAAGAGNHSEWFGYDFGEPKTFDTVVVYPSKEDNGSVTGMPNAYAIEVSEDGVNYFRVFETFAQDVTALGGQTAQFTAVTARYVRFVAISMNKDSSGVFATKICEMAVYDRNYKNTEPYCPNLAVGKTMTSSATHVDQTWVPALINDGNRYNMATATNYGQLVGWHSVASNTTEDAWIAIDLGEKTFVDKVVIWPATQRFELGRTADGEWQDGLTLPLTMKIEVMVGDNWVAVDSLDTMPTVWGPIEFTFDRTEATAVRLYMTRNNHVKLSEFEIYDTEKMVTPGVATKRPGVNLAPEGNAFGSTSVLVAPWHTTNLNNGVIEASGGFTTLPADVGPVYYCGIAFSDVVVANKLVLYSGATGEDEGVWSGIPRSFKVQYSNNNINWTDATEVSFETPVSGQDPFTVTFKEVEAKYFRIWTDDAWAKTSDGGRTYIQLAEMELYYDPFLLSSEDAFSAYYQEKEGEGNTHDLRVLLVANLAKLPDAAFLNVKIEFTLAAGGTKTVEGKLGGADSDYTLYQKATAGGDTYTAADGCAIFGNVITDIPDGAYTGVKVTISNGNDVILSVSK